MCGQESRGQVIFYRGVLSQELPFAPAEFNFTSARIAPDASSSLLVDPPLQMILYDGIVFSLQRAGGISVLFKEIMRRMPIESYKLIGHGALPPTELAHARYVFRHPRLFERYRRADFAKGAELFHSTYYRLPLTKGTRVITTVYDFVYERFASVPRRLVHTTQKRYAVDGADRIICISESTRRDLLELMGYRYEDRAIVVPLAASDAFYPLPLAEPSPQVLFVGTRGGYKNFNAVVEALSGMPGLALLCVGGGPLSTNERWQLERLLPGRYRATGYLTNEELNREYNRSLCLAYPSRYEGFGIPVLEAMRAGCPVVAMRSSSIPEVAGDAAILLELGTPDEIQSAIARLTVPSTRKRYVALGAANADRFSWEETYRRTVDVYEQIIGRPLSEPPPEGDTTDLPHSGVRS